MGYNTQTDNGNDDIDVNRASDYDIEKLFSYIFYAQKYQEDLEKALKSQLWEYATILTWKSIILFFYEKLFQINWLNELSDCFQESLKRNGRDCINCFSFNCLKDDKIGERIGEIWRNVDQNYKNSFNGLLAERNSLSHVNEYNYSKIKFDAFLEKALELLEHLQGLHEQNLEKVVQKIKDSNDFPILSEQEIYRLLSVANAEEKVLQFLVKQIPSSQISDQLKQEIKDHGLDVFLASSSFDSAINNGKNLLIPLSKYMEKEEVVNILERLFQNNVAGHNQLLDAVGMEDILLKLYSESINTFPDLADEWLKFKHRLAEYNFNSNFPNLITEIETALF